MKSRPMRAVVGVFLVILSLPISAAEPSPEVFLPSPENKDAYAPCAAYGKEMFLVAWQSGRLAEGDLRKGVKGQSDIVGVRVSRDGKPLDAKPIVISTAKNMRQSPRVAFGGGIFLVVWHDLRNGKDWDLFAARVSPEGKVLDPDGIAICTEPRNQALPRVVWDGTAFLVVWQDYRSTERYEVYGARVSPEGKVLDAGGNLLESAKDRHRYAPAAASLGGGKSLMLWNGDIRIGTGTIAGGVVVTDGKPVSKVVFDSDARKHGPGFQWVPMSLTAGPTGYLVAWTTDNTLGRDPGPADTNASILDADGKRKISLLLAGKAHRTRDPDAAWDGSGFVAVWHEAIRESKDTSLADAVFGSRISPEGKVSDVQQLSGTFQNPAAMACAASDGKGLTLVTYEKHPNKGDVPIKIGVRVLTAK